MGPSKNAVGNAGSRKKFVVVEAEDPGARSWKMRLLVLLAIFCAGLSMAGGYLIYKILNPPNEAMQIQQAAKVLGIPMTGKNLLGVTFVKSNPEGDSMNLTYKCVNCGYEGPTFVVNYPNEPGPGWRKHDLAPIIKPLTTTAAAVAMELE